MAQNQLTPDDLYNYAKRCFRIKNLNVYRFAKWSDARRFHKGQKRTSAQMAALSVKAKALRNVVGEPLEINRPALPADVKFITVPYIDGQAKPRHRDFCLNLKGKSSVR